VIPEDPGQLRLQLQQEDESQPGLRSATGAFIARHEDALFWAGPAPAKATCSASQAASSSGYLCRTDLASMSWLKPRSHTQRVADSFWRTVPLLIIDIGMRKLPLIA